jgi:hypothetical protein
MTVRWFARVPVYLAFCVAPGLLGAQTPAGPRLAKAAAPPAVQPFQHHKTLLAAYDSVADSTHLSVVTHKGKYFLTMQRPRLTWSVVYPGREPGATPPTQMELEFRTQEPQAAKDSRLVILYGSGQQLEVQSTGGYSDPGVQTWSYFMRFPVSCADLAEALGSDQVRVTVGGISERMKPDQAEALRDLLSRVGAWPDGSVVQRTP